MTTLLGCDFTQPIYKNIIEAQENIRIGRYDRAIKIYEEIIESNPSIDIKVKMFYQLGDLYSKNLINNTKSLKYYQLVIKNSDDPLWLVKAQERIAEISFSFNKDYSLSIDSYKSLTKFLPKLEKFDLYQYRLAKSLYLSGDIKSALVEYKSIKKSRSSSFYTHAHFDEALIYFHLKKWKKTIDLLEDYINLEPKRDKIIEAKYILANCFEMIEDLKKAYNIYYSILGKYPNTKIINNRLNSIYERRVARKR